MNPMHLFLALIPSLLIVLFINRINANSKSKIISFRNLFFLIASWVAILIVFGDGPVLKGSPEQEVKILSRKLSSTINPDMLSEMINSDINFISGKFYETGFKRIEIFDNENKAEYRFTLLYNPENNQHLTSEKNWFDFERKSEIREYANVKPMQPDVIHYILKRSNDYYQYYNYLIEIGNQDKSSINQSSGSEGNNHDVIIKYHNCFFVFKGFQVLDNGYRIEARRTPL